MVILEKDKTEYQEANALLRHYNSTSWIAVSIFFSTAFAILGLTWQVEELTVLIHFAAISMGLYIIGLLIAKRFWFYCDEILERIWKLERQMGLDLHLLIKRKDEEATLKSPILHSLGKLHNLIILILSARSVGVP